tara:strand:- start:510 stop:1022 length:513 start_codon:yes stop_codon:yes gene_type:complete
MNEQQDGKLFLIRDAKASDRKAILSITAAVFGPSTYEKNLEDMFGVIGNSNWVQRKQSHLNNDLGREDGNCKIAEVAGDLAGYVTFTVNDQSRIGVIPNLAVAREYTNQGIGRKLLTHAIEEMRTLGAEVVRIETLEQNDIGQHLYPQLGFQEVARQIYYALDLRSTTEK